MWNVRWWCYPFSLIPMAFVFWDSLVARSVVVSVSTPLVCVKWYSLSLLPSLYPWDCIIGSHRMHIKTSLITTTVVTHRLMVCCSRQNGKYNLDLSKELHIVVLGFFAFQTHSLSAICGTLRLSSTCTLKGPLDQQCSYLYLFHLVRALCNLIWGVSSPSLGSS